MLLTTKTTVPHAKADTLYRERLLTLLRNNLDKKLILIIADAGYGKTTLLGQLIKEARLPCLFYDLDKSDSDLVTFYLYIIAGIEKLSPGLVTRCLNLSKQGSQIGHNYELLMGTLINELVEKRKEEIFIILDDYQNLTEDSLVHKALNYFIDHQPEIVHVIVASRSSVRFPNHAKWFAKQDAFELAKEQLAFTKEETKQLLGQAYHQSLSDGELKTLLEKTEGWITGIQLIVMRAPGSGQRSTVPETLAKYLAAGPADADNNGLFEYFTEEIFSCETKKARKFLVNTSILNLLTPEACNRIFDADDSGKLLRDLEKRNLFISRLGKDEYRLHRLFRDFLQKQISGGDERKRLHLRAAAHYKTLKMMEPAIDHYLEAQSYQLAARAIDQVAAVMEEQAKFTTLDCWLQRLPAEIVRNEPKLLFLKSVIYNYRGCHRESYDTLNRVDQLSKAKGDRSSCASANYEKAHILALEGKHQEALLLLRRAMKSCPSDAYEKKGNIFHQQGLIHMDQGKFEKAEKHLRKAATLLKDRDYCSYLNVLSHLAVLQTRLGDMKQAFLQYKEIIELATRQYSVKTGFTFGNAARIALELGQEQWAGQTLALGWELCRNYEDPWSQCALHFGYGSLYVQKRQWEKAKEHLEKAHGLARDLDYQPIEVGSLRDLVQLYRYTGDYTNARRHLELAWEKLSGNTDNLQGAYLLTAQGQLEAAQGQFDKAGKTLATALKLSSKYGLNSGILKAQLALGEIFHNRNNQRKAVRHIKLALEISRQKGYDGILIRELRHNGELADFAYRHNIQSEYLNTLMPDIRKDHNAHSDADLKVGLFGTMRLDLPNGRVIPLKWWSGKIASLFAYLLVNRQRLCTRDELTALFWPKAKARQAQQDVYTAISLLKKTLKNGCLAAGATNLAKTEFVEHQESSYRLSARLSIWIDVEHFRNEWKTIQALENEGKFEESRKLCGNCIKLYRNGFLANQKERWCEEHRDECEKIYLAILIKYGDHCQKNQEHQEAVSSYRRYLAIEPYAEQIHVRLWRSLKALGMIQEIIADYRQLGKLVKRELSVALEGKTVDAYNKAIMQQA